MQVWGIKSPKRQLLFFYLKRPQFITRHLVSQTFSRIFYYSIPLQITLKTAKLKFFKDL